jgi:hypothetical protein
MAVRQSSSNLPVPSATGASGAPPAPPQQPGGTWRERIADWFRQRQEMMGGYALSAAFHAALLLILGLIVFTAPERHREELITALTSEGVDNEDLLEVVEMPDRLADRETDAMPVEVDTAIVAETSSPVDLDVQPIDPSVIMDNLSVPDANIQVRISSQFGGRTEPARARLVAAHGGNAASEAAVARGLRWLAAHQNDDGGWSFDHVRDECEGSCTHPGRLRNRPTGATAMALLCFLGAGHTHEYGDYRQTVGKGIGFLLSEGKSVSDGLDLRGGDQGNSGMYIQGLASIALCEAYAMTRDRKLRQPAQSAVTFISRAQDSRGGGWRYQPRQPGDTSIVGWQLMALQSARAGRLRVSSTVLQRTTRFLNHVQAEDGAHYGYTSSQAGRPGTTAIGLLCRMYLGWNRDHPALARGVAFLSQTGPSETDMYYNYYATQVLHHWGGPEWEKWNEVMRDRLVETQVTEGHAAGSWSIEPSMPWTDAGGRLYQTCLCIMTLEVYYRHLPLYQREAVSDE